MATLPAPPFNEGLYGDGYYVDGASQNFETSVVNKSLTPLPPPVFTGMKLQEDIIIGDLVLNTIDSSNVIWVCTDIEGWWGHPDPEIPDVTRGWRDGSYDARGRWQARQLTLNGVILPPEPEFLPAARNTLIEATNLVYTGAWLKTKENPTRAAFVRLSGRPEISTVTARGRTEFSIGLRAADPIKYSWNDSDPEGYNLTTITAENVGTIVVNSYPTSGQIIAAGLPSTLYPATGPQPLVAGNIVLTSRPLVPNFNDEISTLLTMSFNDNSNEVVIPTVVNGSILTEEQAIAHYSSTGQHLGKFASGNWQDAVTYANNLHTIQEAWLDLIDYTWSGKISGLATVTNVGNTPVSVFLEVTGPIVGDATITNETTNEVLTIISPMISTDLLEIDTYEREVSFNGDTYGARVKIDTLVDWITLDPGANTIKFIDPGQANSTAVLKMYYRSGWIG